MKPKRLHPLLVTGLAVMVSFVVACGDDDGGDGNGNGNGMGPAGEPVGTYGSQSQAVEDIVDQFFVENEAVNTVNVLSSLIAGVGFDIAPVLSLIRPDLSLLKFIEHLQQTGGVGPLPSIPAGLKGTVFVLAEAPFQYVPDPGQTGPANGVRFILYDVDLVTGLPSTPLQATGHVDIIETGPSPTDLTFTVFINDIPHIDLTIDATIGPIVNMTLFGFLGDGSEQINVSFSLSGTVTDPTFDLAADLSLDAPTAEISVATSASGTIEAPLVTNGIDVFVFGTFFTIGFFIEFDGSDGTLDGSVFVGADGLVAHIEGTPDSFSLVPAGEGEPLGTDDLSGLLFMIGQLDAMFEGSLDLIGLVSVVIGFALL